MDQSIGLVQQFVVDPLREAMTQLGKYAPSVLGALIILLIGGIIAKGLEQLLIRGLKRVSLDKLADQVQLSNVLAKGGVRFKLSELIGIIVYWLVLLAFVMAALDVLKIELAASLLDRLVGYLPQVIASVFILIIGIFAAAFLSATVRTAASNAGVLQAHLLGQLVQVIVILAATVIALEQLQIAFVGNAFLIILGGISLGCALAFGLGCKDAAGKWLEETISQVKSRKH